MTTRTEFFDRLRAEVKKTRGLFPATTSARPQRPQDVAETIVRELAERWAQTLDRFRMEFERVGGVFHRVATCEEVPATITRIARDRDVHRLVAWKSALLRAETQYLAKNPPNGP